MNLKYVSLFLVFAISSNAFIETSTADADMTVIGGMVNIKGDGKGNGKGKNGTPVDSKGRLIQSAQNQKQKGQEQSGEATKWTIQPNPTGNKTIKCLNDITEYEEAVNKQKAGGEQQVQLPPEPKECYALRAIALTNYGTMEPVDVSQTVKESVDKKFSCRKAASYTVDYEGCIKSLAIYNSVVNAEVALDVGQKVATDLKNASIQKNTAEKAKTDGDYQAAAFDAGIQSNNHQKKMQEQRVYAFGTAVTALSSAVFVIPGKKKATKDCQGDHTDEKSCQMAIKNNERAIFANSDAKSALAQAVMVYSAKAAAAGFAMKQYDNSAQKIAEAQNSIEDDSQDVMVERCMWNPKDPACVVNGERTAGSSFAAGEFSFGGGSGNQAFNLDGEKNPFGEEGAQGTKNENSQVAGVNSPFNNEAASARDILNPAAAAQVQAQGGAGGGGGGGAGGGGGGGASLGNDIQGANKEGDKEAQIKANKVSGTYGNAGGGGFQAVGKSKDDGNPFASLFDQQSNGGGIEEDRSIASGDIDGAASGLFQKISKRYSQIQADKRIEAQDLE